MPTINLCFQGWIRGATIRQALNTKTGNTIDVSRMSSQKFVDKLNKGELAISLTEALDDCSNSSVELHDYEPTE